MKKKCKFTPFLLTLSVAPSNMHMHAHGKQGSQSASLWQVAIITFPFENNSLFLVKHQSPELIRGSQLLQHIFCTHPMLFELQSIFSRDILSWFRFSIATFIALSTAATTTFDAVKIPVKPKILPIPPPIFPKLRFVRLNVVVSSIVVHLFVHFGKWRRWHFKCHIHLTSVKVNSDVCQRRSIVKRRVSHTYAYGVRKASNDFWHLWMIHILKIIFMLSYVIV